MDVDIVTYFASVRIGDLELPTTIEVPGGTEVSAAVSAMAEVGQSGAVVTDESGIIGIFTERDITTKVARSPDRWDRPVDEFMTPDPLVISTDETAVAALRLLNVNRIRNLPVLDDANAFVGTLTYYDLIRVASAHLRANVDSGHDLTTEASLRFIDLTGIEAREPLRVSADRTVSEAIDLMIEAGTGLVSVVDDRGAVIGEFTEHDVFTKLACRVTDLDDEVVGSWLTEVIAGTLPTTSIADGLHLMAEVGHRYLVLLNENNHALGVLTFRDIAEYFETALQVN
jgi:CBS domain-containing protein